MLSNLTKGNCGGEKNSFQVWELEPSKEPLHTVDGVSLLCGRSGGDRDLIFNVLSGDSPSLTHSLRVMPQFFPAGEGQMLPLLPP